MAEAGAHGVDVGRLDGCFRAPRPRVRGRDVDWIEDRAQATLEYALVLAACLALVVGLSALWRAGVEGALARLAEQAASHAFTGAGAVDIALY